MRICVAIACYNQGRFLAEAIESVLAQSRRADEVIVIDDGSQDETPQVCARYPQVTAIRLAHAGISAARNTALAHTDCELILFLDADDWLTPGALEHAERAFRNHPGAAYVHGGYREMDGTGTVLHEARPAGEVDVYAALLRGNYIAMHGTVLYDARILRASGGFDPQLATCEDYEVYLRLARDNPVGHYPQIAAIYRRHDNAVSRDYFRMMEGAHLVLDRHAPDREERRDAWRMGREHMTAWYADAALDQVAAQVKAGHLLSACKLIAKGLRADTNFAGRAARRLGAYMRQRFG